MDNNEKRTKAIGLIEDIYGESGMAVVNMMTDYLTDDDWANLYDRLERDGMFTEPEPKQLSFDELVQTLQCWAPRKPAMNMTIEAVRDECRQFIRDSGWECLDDNFDEDREAADYIEEHHPDWDTSGFSWSSVNYSTLDFYCKDDIYGDLTRAEMNVTFYGDWEKQIGVFNVTD